MGEIKTNIIYNTYYLVLSMKMPNGTERSQPLLLIKTVSTNCVFTNKTPL